MLDLGQIGGRTCQGIGRRAALQVGACSALGLSLGQWFAARASAAAPKPKPLAKSVILLWMWGGPSHHEMWDPKPQANVEVRGPFRPIDTATPGVRIGELLPLTAKASGMYTILRGMNHDNKDHNCGGTINLTGSDHGAQASGANPLPGRVRPSMGSLVSYLGNRQVNDWPAFTCIGPICDVSAAAIRGQGAGILGSVHDPFRLQGFSFEEGVKLPESLAPLPELGERRLDQRRGLLGAVDNWQRRLETVGTMDRFSDLQQRAYSLVTSAGAKTALNLDAEAEALRDRYGRTVFGQNCILARRLVEAGVPFVQLNWSQNAEDEQQGGDGGWDLHYRLFERMQERYCPIFDRAFAALLADLKHRGLFDSTLVLALGEFGRSPKISASGGREHWPWVYSIVVAGGGMPGGLVVGASDGEGGYPTANPHHPADLLATVLDRLGLDRQRLFEKESSIAGHPIPELL